MSAISVATLPARPRSARKLAALDNDLAKEAVEVGARTEVTSSNLWAVPLSDSYAGEVSGSRGTRRHLHLVPPPVAQEARVASMGVNVFVRRRLIFALALIVMVLGGGLAGRALAAGDGGSARPIAVVKQGETLSDVAARVLPGEANAAAVLDLQRANNLNTTSVEAGEKLVIPAGK